MLYDMTKLTQGAPLGDDALIKVERTTFAAQNITERGHLQAALRDHIELIDADLHVVSEEFGDFEGALRRIDLLCIDKNCRLVVVELKRTADGGHMELQALRYAAMVSTMTFAQLVRTYIKYRQARGRSNASEAMARAELIAWLGVDDDDEPEVSREVGVVLASEDFSQEITTTVLWLNEFHAFDIRCVRLSPYVLGDRVLLDVQHVIPLPEASVYTVKVREKENAVRQAASVGNADFTKFVVQTPDRRTAPLAKRWAMLRLVEAMVEHGTPMDRIKTILPASKALLVDGTYGSADELWAAVRHQHSKDDDSRKRWHVEDPIEVGDRTWIINNNWGTQTREMFKQPLEIAAAGISVHEEGDTAIAP